jgi:type I restriction enzyme S subunit
MFSTLRLDDLGKGIKPGLSRKEAYALPIALPPLAEQKRIVAKVDELMALCDRLEAQQLEREAQAGQLARASLTRFADAPTPANINLLFHSSFPISPSDLRKSILTLAVQGKLVPFDTNGEEQAVGDHIEFQNGYAFKSEWFKPSGMRLCRNLNVSHGTLDWRESAFVDEKVAKEFERLRIMRR